MNPGEQIVASIIIPTFNRVIMLEQCLNAVVSQTCPSTKYEIIVVQDGPNETSKKTIDKFNKLSKSPTITYLQQDRKGPAAARNTGAQVAQGRFLVFTDDDCVPDKHWLESHCDYLEENPGLAAVGGPIIPMDTKTVINRFFRFQSPLETLFTQDNKPVFLVTANAVFTKTAFEKCYGFDETFKWPGGEDPDLSFRMKKLGYVLGFNQSASVYHHYPTSCTKLILTSFNYGKGSYHISLKHPREIHENKKPSLSYPFRVIEHTKLLKAYIHARKNVVEASQFWIINYLVNTAELMGRLWEHLKYKVKKP